ncbi:MAG TPA: FtsX-like permease family protein [Anaerolineales bacterium]
MLSARWYKVLHDLLGSKTRTVLIVLSMAVGLFAVGIILSARDILMEGLAQSFAAISPSSGVVHTLELFDEDFIRSVRDMPHVADADARRYIPARVETSPGEWENLWLYVVADYNDVRVDKVSPLSGIWPPPPREMLVERSAMPVLDARVGQILSVKLANDTIRQVRIAGLAHDPAQMPAQIDSTPYAYITFDTLDWFGQPYGFNELHIVSDRPWDKAWSQQVVNQVKTKAEKAGYTIPMTMTADPGMLPLDDVLQGLLLLMGFLGLMSLGLSVFLVVNTVSALLAQQKRQIGVMKAVGGTTPQILGMYLVMTMLYGAAALVLAVPLGIVGARALSRGMASFFNFDLTSVNIAPQAILIQLAIGLILPVLASLFPFLSGLRISPSEAMSSYTMGRGRFGVSRLDRLLSGERLWFLRGLPVRSLLLSLRNTFRSKGRLALTLITLTLGSATFMSVFNVRVSLSSTVDDMMKWFACDVMIVFEQPYRADKAVQQAMTIPGVSATDVLLVLTGRRVRPDDTESKALYLFAPTVKETSLMHSPTIVSGRYLLPDDENAIIVPTAFLDDEPDLELGGDMVLKIFGDEHTFKIVGTFIGTSYLDMFFVPYDYMSRITDRAGETDALLVATNKKDMLSVNAISRRLEDQFAIAGLRVDAVSTLASERADAEVLFDVLVSLLLVMAVLLALVGGLGLMGTMSINVLERTREIGVLRAIGAHNRAVAQVFILEGVGIGVLSWIMGAALAIPMTRGLNSAVGAAMLGQPLTYAFSMQGMWLWLLAVVILSALASFIPARNASRLTVREVLAYE